MTIKNDDVYKGKDKLAAVRFEDSLAIRMLPPIVSAEHDLDKKRGKKG